MKEEIGGIIMAGGMSSRMGTDKALVIFEGKRLIDYAIDLLKPFCTEIIISTNQRQHEKLGFRTVADRYQKCGPIGGLHAALTATNFDHNIVISCDVPFVQSELIELLLANTRGFDAVVPVHKCGIEPLVAVYRKEMASFFETQLIERNYKLQQVIHSSKLNLLEVDRLVAKYPRLFDNMNSMEELNKF